MVSIVQIIWCSILITRWYNEKIDYINKILVDTDAVVILSHDEDNILKKNGLNKVMPKNWKFGDSIFARYDFCEIKVLEKKIKMKGAIRR